jgi:hypothetical protein
VERFDGEIGRLGLGIIPRNGLGRLGRGYGGQNEPQEESFHSPLTRAEQYTASRAGEADLRAEPAVQKPEDYGNNKGRSAVFERSEQNK